MIEDFINDCMDSLDSIDTTEVESDGMNEDTTDFYDSFGDDEDVFSDLDTDDLNDCHTSLNDENFATDEESEAKEHQHTENKSSSISFMGSGKCNLCPCGAFAGCGDVCNNCGHFWKNHCRYK